MLAQSPSTVRNPNTTRSGPDLAVNVSVSAMIQLVRTAANNAVPLTVDAAPYNININGGADNCGKGVSLGYHVERTPISVTGAGITLSASTELDYWLKARARKPCVFGSGPLIYGSCGVGDDWPRRMTLAINFDFAGVDNTWSPKINISLAGLTPQNPCQVTLVNIDVTPQVRTAVSDAINGSLPELNQALIDAIKLPERANQGWAVLLQPLSVAPSGGALELRSGGGASLAVSC